VSYLYLALAIIAEVAEVADTSELKASQEFTRLYPSLIVVTGYGLEFYLMTPVIDPGGHCLRTMGRRWRRAGRSGRGDPPVLRQGKALKESILWPG
jgi:hypothetical protein